MLATSGGRPHSTSITGSGSSSSSWAATKAESRAPSGNPLARGIVHRVGLVEEEGDPAALGQLADVVEGDPEAILEDRTRASRGVAQRHGHPAAEIEADLPDGLLRGAEDALLELGQEGELLDGVEQVVGDGGGERVLVAQPRAEIPPHDNPPLPLGHSFELLEQDGLADAAEAGDAEIGPLLGIVLEQAAKAPELLSARSVWKFTGQHKDL